MENEKDQEAVIEAVLFTIGGAVELRQLAAAIGQDKETAKRAVERLAKRYREETRGMEIKQLEDSYQMCTRSEYYESLIRVAAAPKKQVLSDVVLETLSIIAYRQPVTKMEIEKIRGVKSDHAVSRLVEYDLVYEANRLDAPGRPPCLPLQRNLCAGSVWILWESFGCGSGTGGSHPGRGRRIQLSVEELQKDMEE